jgi:hypothetical protein
VGSGKIPDPTVGQVAALAGVSGVPAFYLVDRGRESSVLDEERFVAAERFARDGGFGVWAADPCAGSNLRRPAPPSPGPLRSFRRSRPGPAPTPSPPESTLLKAGGPGEGPVTPWLPSHTVPRSCQMPGQTAADPNSVGVSERTRDGLSQATR